MMRLISTEIHFSVEDEEYTCSLHVKLNPLTGNSLPYGGVCTNHMKQIAFSMKREAILMFLDIKTH